VAQVSNMNDAQTFSLRQVTAISPVWRLLPLATPYALSCSLCLRCAGY
jgi:hypothetical protein